ncbi:hypothetical protein SLEP1_g17944 [Rubroshorea leprosula]|uniref:Uncharacterized protein n=1 Tax=Rubroshorea leprosula TaxID=152421 RepID=A0AAV5J1F2_9ROSI|nr:hypothetical protein SLEP1_g17944 [Rubroshorea leprosula]
METRFTPTHALPSRNSVGYAIFFLLHWLFSTIPRLLQSTSSKRLKDESLHGSQSLSSSRQQKSGHSAVS